MKIQRHTVSVACLLFLLLMMASVTLAAPPVEQLPPQSMPAMRDALSQCDAGLARCNNGLAQCNTSLNQCNTDLNDWKAHPRFSVLNPRGDRPPITAVAPTARLASLTPGMTIAIVANYDGTMARLATAFFDAGYKVIFVSDLPVAPGQSPRPIQLAGVTNMSLVDFEKNPKQASAIIVGNGF